MEALLPLAEQVYNQAHRRVILGQKVPAQEKIVSIFETHTDIICRGKKGSPTEFGHKFDVATGRSGLVTRYEVAVPKPGRLSEVRRGLQKAPWFRRLMRLRAGVEGNLSTLLRSFGLKRCLWRGWESFKAYIGLGVLTYNLRLLAGHLARA